MNRQHTATGIILKRQDYAEKDRIITLLTKEFGKITVLAKGVRNLHSKRQGHLELFSHVTVSFHKAQGMGILTEVETVDQFNDMLVSWERLGHAFHVGEIVDRLLPDEEQNSRVYEILLRFLRAISNETDYSAQIKIVRLCEQTLLDSLGYWDTQTHGVYNTVQDKPQVKERNIGFIQAIIERELKSIRVFEHMDSAPVVLKDY